MRLVGKLARGLGIAGAVGTCIMFGAVGGCLIASDYTNGFPAPGPSANTASLFGALIGLVIGIASAIHYYGRR